MSAPQARHAKLNAEFSSAILNGQLQQIMPAILEGSLQQAGIPVDAVRSYIPAVLGQLIPNLAQHLIGLQRSQGLIYFVDTSTPLGQQIMQQAPQHAEGYANATQGPMRTAMNPVQPVQQQAPRPVQRQPVQHPVVQPQNPAFSPPQAAPGAVPPVFTPPQAQQHAAPAAPVFQPPVTPVQSAPVGNAPASFIEEMQA